MKRTPLAHRKSLGMRVVLVKHAVPIRDALRPPREWPLAPDGERQSKQLAAALKRFSPRRLVTSPEPKARRMAEIVAAEFGLAVVIVAGLRGDRPPCSATPLHVRARRDQRESLDAF